MKKHICQRTESRVRVLAAIDPWDLFYVSQRETDRQRDLGELVLVVCVDTEARHWRAGEAGAVRQFPHSTDVTHRFVFQSRRRDFHIVLLVYRLEDKHTHTHTRRRTGLLFLFGKGQKCDVDRNQIVVPLTHEGAGDVFRHLVTRATHLWQVGQLSVQHPLKLWQNESKTVRDVPFL